MPPEPASDLVETAVVFHSGASTKKDDNILGIELAPSVRSTVMRQLASVCIPTDRISANSHQLRHLMGHKDSVAELRHPQAGSVEVSRHGADADSEAARNPRD